MVFHGEMLLIVDDKPDNVAVLYNFLTNAGFEVVVAQNGEQAIQTAEYAKPALILLDVMMPDINGFEVCQALKSRCSTRDIPIIFVTALTDTVDKVKGFDLGAADYITKPFHREEVLARINSHLHLRKLQQTLQTQKIELEAQNQQLKNQIEVRKKVEESLQLTTNLLAERSVQLQQRTEELERRNTELDAFARTVAHDLKNPLSAIQGLIELQEQAMYEIATVPDPKCLEYNHWMNQSIRKVFAIIDALLLLAGVSRKANVEILPLDMLTLVKQVIQQRLESMIVEYKATIQLPETLPVVLGYAPWVEEIWVNYLSNGIKYGGQPPHLEIGANCVSPNKTLENGEAEEFVRFWIRDNGAGLEPTVQTKLFTPFTRLHKNRAEGHGLGLSIVQQIAEKLGGQVGVESEIGRGSLFYFTLPACKTVSTISSYY